MYSNLPGMTRNRKLMKTKQSKPFRSKISKYLANKLLLKNKT